MSDEVFFAYEREAEGVIKAQADLIQRQRETIEGLRNGIKELTLLVIVAIWLRSF